MRDIVELSNGKDMRLFDTAVSKAGNVASVQLGVLEYAQEFGVDLKYFLESEFQIQNESFKAYIVQRLTESQISVAQVIDFVETLYTQYTYVVGDTSKQNEGLIL